MDAGEGDEGGDGLGEVLVVFGDAAVAAEPGKGSLDDPAARQDHEAFRVVAALDDLHARHGNLGDGSRDLPGVVGAIGPDQFEPGKALADLVEDKGGAVAVLDAGGMNDDPDRQPFGIDERVNLAPLDLLPGVIAYLAVEAAPFSADFSDWLSMTAAVGDASRPCRWRKLTCSCSQIASQTPSLWNLRKML